jgi:hypothetical protein
MIKDDRNRPGPRDSRAAANASATMYDRDIASKAVLDNMAKLKALRLAREAAEPPRPAAAPKKARAKSTKSGEKTPALAQWLAGQQSGGRRT